MADVTLQPTHPPRSAIMVALAILLLSSAPAKAEPTRSFHDLVADAWAQLPQRQDIAARRTVAAARFRAGGALVPDAPFVTGSYVNDKILGSNQNYITTQVEVSTPVWLPGEGTAMQNTARAEGAAAEAAGEAAHLALASQLLDLATQAALAENARSVAARRLATAQALAADLARRFRVGEAAQSDALAADADAASAAATLSSAETDLASLRTTLAELTGSEALARLDGPQPAGPAGLPAEWVARHPRVVAAEQAVAAAEANERLVRIQNRDDPQIGLQGTDEKQPGTRWDTRFGVVVRFSFATEARNAPRRAAAEQATTQAMVQLALARREVLTAIGQAQVARAGAERGSVAAEKAALELDRRRGQIDRAWRAGEMPLIEVVRANALAFDAAYARDKARTMLGAAGLRVRLAEGEVP
jgi:outer membrane protein TolC